MACKEATEEISELDNKDCNQKESNGVHSASSKLNLPNETADNMKDLKPFDFNSADEVRQNLKAVLNEKESNFEETGEDYVPVNVGDEELQRNKLNLHLMSKVTGTDDLKHDDKYMMKTIQPRSVLLLRNNKSGISRKRRGRPPKAGPSKKIKKPRVTTFYIGKLSNVVFLKRKRGSD